MNPSTRSSLPEASVLLLIDLQQAIDHPSWGVRNNLGAEAEVAALLACWRARGWPVWHVRHDSTRPQSHYRPEQAGHDFKPGLGPLSTEVLIPKQTNNAFIGTDLDARLKAAGHRKLVVAGVITNNSVEATVRMAGNLGYDTYLVADACFTFGRTDWNGQARSADEVHAMSLANLDGEYCTVVTSKALLAGLTHTMAIPSAPVDMPALDGVTLKRLNATEAAARLDDLAGVLIDCVEGGASVSFMLPLARDKAEAFWRGVSEGVGRNERVLLIAEDADGEVLGTVQLVTAQPDNQPHRADIAKMLVHRKARRRGIAQQLMDAVEQEARKEGKTVLVLDTVTGGDAERLYQRAGWLRAGEVPKYALMPDGELCGTTFYYKHL